jgi:hypothetical protein
LHRNLNYSWVQPNPVNQFTQSQRLCRACAPAGRGAFAMSEIITLGRGTGKESAEVEQRQHVRFPCKLRAARTADKTETFKPALLGRVVNISSDGIALHLGERFEVGALLTIQLCASIQAVSATMEIRVVHATRQPHGTWVLGAAFLVPLGETDLQRFLS